MKTALLAAALCTSIHCSAPASAQSGTAFTYQGELMESGVPADGSYSMSFKLFDAIIGGSQVGSTVNVAAQTVADGIFSRELDFGVQDMGNSAYWIEIVVEGNALLPRVAMTGAPFSVQTRGFFVDDENRVGVNMNAPSAQTQMHVRSTTGDNFGVLVDSFGVLGSQIGLHTGTSGYASLAKNSYFSSGWRRFSDGQGAFLQEIDPGGNVYFNVAPSGENLIGWNNAMYLKASNGYVGMGTTSPSAKLNVKSTVGDGLVAETSGNIGKAVYGFSTAPTGASSGVFGHVKSNGGRGVYGLADSSTGLNYGVYGWTSSNQGRGVYGNAQSGSGTTYGVYGRVVSPNGFAGYFQGGMNYFEGNVGIGVNPVSAVALNMSTSSERGISCTTSSSSNNAVAVLGITTATSAGSTGVLGESASSSGIGVTGFASSQSGTTYAVLGWASSSSGYDFYAGGSGINYGATSSRRWKTDIVNIDNPLGKLAQLRGVYYNWDEEHGGHHAMGMIAEEVGEVLPEIVGYEENGIDAVGLDYSMLTPLLVEATNALRAQNEAEIKLLKVDVDRLQSENDLLRARLDHLERLMVRAFD
jgi:hypothetical protein